jgi:hypothetical protein
MAEKGIKVKELVGFVCNSMELQDAFTIWG